MGIYSNGIIYGVGWRVYDASDNLIQEYERKFPTKMTPKNVEEVKRDFDRIEENDKSTISIYFITMASTSYDVQANGEFLTNWPGDVSRLQELFKNGDVAI